MSTRTLAPMKSAAAKPLVITRTSSSMLQRKCACGGSPKAGGECDACKKKLQRKTASTPGSTTPPPIVHEVLHSSGQPLDAGARAFFEPRFGHDFSKVRVHADLKAAQSAQAVNAMAYTVGNHLVFGAGRYAPGLSHGRQLLAHELTHVVQQASEMPQSTATRGLNGAQMAEYKEGLRIGLPGDAYEREAELVSHAILADSGTHPVGKRPVQSTAQPAGFLQRKLVVNPTDSVPLAGGASGPPTPLTIAIQGLIGDMCPDGHFQVDQTTGNVPANPDFCRPFPGPPFLTADVSSTPVGCGCICDVISNSQTTTIAFRAGPPGTSPGSQPGPAPAPGQAGQKTSPTVSADPRFQGQYLINGKWVDIPFHLIFAHELCGHALPKMQGTHVPRGAAPAGGTPPQEQHAVDVERQIAAEQNLPRRPEDYSGGARQKP